MTSIMVKVVVPLFVRVIEYAMSSPAEWPSIPSASSMSHVASAERTPVLLSGWVALEEFVIVHPGPGEHRTLSDKRGKGTEIQPVKLGHEAGTCVVRTGTKSRPQVTPSCTHAEESTHSVVLLTEPRSMSA